MRLHRFLPQRWQVSPPPTSVSVRLVDGREIPARLERTGRRRWVARVLLAKEDARHGMTPSESMPPAKTELSDPEWQEMQAAALRALEETGLVEPGGSVKYDGGDGAYRARFTVRARVDPDTAPRHYNLSEVEFCTYVMALADLAPHLAGEAGIALADASREEARRGRL